MFLSCMCVLSRLSLVCTPLYACIQGSTNHSKLYLVSPWCILAQVFLFRQRMFDAINRCCAACQPSSLG